jgi:hypothetical protein
MEAFLLRPANRQFAEGKGPYQPDDLRHSASSAGRTSKILMIAGVVATLGAGVLYLHQEEEHAQLLASVKSVTAQVTGCAGYGLWTNVRFHYTVDGKVYDELVWENRREFQGRTTLIDACQTNTVELNYNPLDPTHWSAAPISPFSRDEQEAKPSGNMFIAGPVIFALGLAFAFGSFVYRKQMAMQDILKAQGIALKGELLKMEEDSDSPVNVICFYQFINPAGVSMKGRSEGPRPDLKKADFPPPGTPIYVIYASDRLFPML